VARRLRSTVRPCMSSKDISAVLPLRISSPHQDLARCELLLASLSFFAAPGLFREIIVVVPRQDEKAVRVLLHSMLLPLKVVCEDRILPLLPEYPAVNGWWRQQIIKLAVASKVDTEFCLTLDADVILCKPLTFEHLVVEGKALLEPESRKVHSQWWQESAETLGVENDLDAPGMSVTPAVLSKSVCNYLFRDLEKRFNCHWAEALLTRLTWTEYTLYYLTAEKHAILDQYHRLPGPGERRLFSSKNVWALADFNQWNAASCFDQSNPGLFVIIQSNTGIPPRKLKGLISRHVPLRRRSISETLKRIFWRCALFLSSRTR
jgi:hypothetical protein